MVTDRRQRFRRWWATGWAAILFVVMTGVTILTLAVWSQDREASETSPVTDLAFFALGSMIAVGFASQIRSPEENTAGTVQAGAASTSLALAGLIGERIEPLVGGVVLMAAVGVLFALHPDRGSAFRAVPGPRIAPLGMALLAAPPSLVYANRMFAEAADAGPSCFLGRCASGDRLAEIGAAALATALLAALGGSRLTGWRVPLWMASATAVLIGSLSLGFPAEPGAVGSGWAVGAIAWGLLLPVVSNVPVLRGSRWREGSIAPVRYSLRSEYRPPPGGYRRMQWLGVLLTAAGMAPRSAVTLEVRGRTTGTPRRTPVVCLRVDGQRFLVSLAGESQWVRNVRAAGGQAVLIRRSREPVRLVEVPVEDRTPVIRAYISGDDGRWRGAQAATVDAYFGLGPDPTADDIREVARYYPTFQVVKAS